MSNKTHKKRNINFITIFLITLNAILASSLTYLPGRSVQLLGAKAVIAWFIIFGIGLYVSMALAELVSLFPHAGDLYVYAKHAFGHFIAFIVGWTSWLAGNITASLAIVWALEYFNSSSSFQSYMIKLAIGLGLIILINFAKFRGLSLNKIVFIGFSVITLFVISLQILPMFFNLSSISGVTVTTFSLKHFLQVFHAAPGFTITALFATLFFISEAFMGLEVITFLSEEVKSAKTIPRALIYAMSAAALLTILYVVGSIGTFSIGKYVSAIIPHKTIIHTLWSLTMSNIIFIGTAIMIIAPFILWVFIGPRLLRSLGRDKLIFKQLTNIHPKYKTLSNAILFQSIIISLFTIFMYYLYIGNYSDPYKLIHEVFIILVLFVLSVVMLIIPKFRRMYKDRTSFKVFGGKFLPYVLVLFFISISLAYVSYTHEWHLFLKAGSLILLGIPIFFLINIFYNPEVTRRINNNISLFSLIFEFYSLPKRIRKKIVTIFGDITGKRVFEFGSGIGTLTLELAKAVGPTGVVETVDLSESNLKIVNKRAKKKNQIHIKTIHDKHMISRIHPDVHNADLIFSVGSIDYVQNLQKILTEMADLLPENGRICIVEYGDFFGFIPDSGWKSNLKELNKVFVRAGFRIRLFKWKGLFWNYIVIYGIKTNKDIVVI